MQALDYSSEKYYNYKFEFVKFAQRTVGRFFPGHSVFAARCYASAALAIMRCLCVRPSACLFVTFVSCIKMNKISSNFFSLPGSQAILVFHTKRHGNFLTGTPLKGAANTGGVG